MTYHCGNCGEAFDTKGAKRRHKAECQVEYDPDYVPYRATPEIRCRAAEEWNALATPNDVNAAEYTRRHLANMSPGRRAQLEREWA